MIYETIADAAKYRAMAKTLLLFVLSLKQKAESKRSNNKNIIFNDTNTSKKSIFTT